ncbi:MAG: GNAT family protein [Dehalococcoidia bacterium]
MRITTDRLILRDFVEGDWPPMLAWQRDPRHFRYYAWTEDRTEADVRALLQRFLGEQKVQPRRRFQLAITLPESGQIIGDAGIRRKTENDWEADIGYELAPEYWGNGYATEAARALVDMGFREWGLHRISSWCIADNVASARVLERLGLRLEGRLREADFFKGRWWDSLLYGLLVDEWSGSGLSDRGA